MPQAAIDLWVKLPSSKFSRIPSLAMVFSPATTISSGYLRPFRKLSDIVKNSPPPSPPSPSTQLSPSWCLWLISALQGHEITCDVRRKLADDIERMGYVEQEELIEFLESGVAPSTLENNACKQFLCNTTELCSVLTSKDPENLVILWDQLFHHTLPALQSILYPLQRTRPDFNVRRTILTVFRDRVLSKILRDIEGRIPILEPMLYTVLLETENSSEESRQFADLASRIMGTKNKSPAVATVSQSRIRSKTLPVKPTTSKKVTWSDMRKSATFSA